MKTPTVADELAWSELSEEAQQQYLRVMRTTVRRELLTELIDAYEDGDIWSFDHLYDWDAE